ncbi:MAG: VanZ family protein [Bacilli bacterium]
MNSYIVPILYAIIIFPFIAAIFTLPYILVQYRKYGSIPSIRVIIVYSFILYLLSSYFLVILPFPTFTEVKNMTIARFQLIPFTFIKDFLRTTSLVLSNPKTYLMVLKEPIVYQAFYNTLLFIPFGMYLRYYFKCSLKKTFFLSLLLSLFFEITQLTGLYFLYPRNYRMFDVDDLIINTFGGIIGYFLALILFKIFPNRDKIDEIAYKNGKTIPLLRRFIATIIDSVFCLILSFILYKLLNNYLLNNMIIYYCISILIYYVSFTYIFKGYTIGKAILKIKLISTISEKLSLSQLIVRFGLISFLEFIPLYLIKLINYNDVLKIAKSGKESIYFIISLFTFVFVIYIFKKLKDISNGKQLFYEKLSKTKNISTIVDAFTNEIV